MHKLYKVDKTIIIKKKYFKYFLVNFFIFLLKILERKKTKQKINIIKLIKEGQQLLPRLNKMIPIVNILLLFFICLSTEFKFSFSSYKSKYF